MSAIQRSEPTAASMIALARELDLAADEQVRARQAAREDEDHGSDPAATWARRHLLFPGQRLEGVARRAAAALRRLAGAESVPPPPSGEREARGGILPPRAAYAPTAGDRVYVLDPVGLDGVAEGVVQTACPPPHDGYWRVKVGDLVFYRRPESLVPTGEANPPSTRPAVQDLGGAVESLIDAIRRAAPTSPPSSP